ncbi:MULTISPECIES: ABC transporter permease [Colwellia]|uniref:Iron export ABC transporter permease subunit FetB n=1 Tax=Colwellia marinimaniae TaxID=1513592 RepID=A0ABQ0MU86_9GAMM|nr:MULTISPECIES: ABC transporter permease [Colwellia]GAW95916.1 iron export ABC transporter permease subunit FetB [Colwellia marinimaniae]
MEQALVTIPLTKLAIAFIPVVLVLLILARWSLPQKRTLHALVRMLVQLLLVGYVLSYLFASDNAWIIGSLLLVMVLFSTYIALNNIESPQKSLFSSAFLAIFISSFIVLFVITQGVLHLEPWHQAKTLVPLAGMVFANGMNSVSLCGERFYAELNRGEPYQKSRNIAFKASMIPNVNALFAVGIVSLPGMMTGQILAGVSPFIAARYQIMVMCMVFASAGLASAIFLVLNKAKPQ